MRAHGNLRPVTRPVGAELVLAGPVVPGVAAATPAGLASTSAARVPVATTWHGSRPLPGVLGAETRRGG